MKFCVLASGSSGNCIFISSQQTGILIDAGLSARETVRRLEQIGVPIAGISAICLTHEHGDHVAGLFTLNQRHDIKLYANSGTISALNRDPKMQRLQWQIFSTGSGFQIGDLTIDPFPVSHDAYEPVGFIVSCGNSRVGIATDIGAPTHLVRELLRPCRALIIESNHDEQLLAEAKRPWTLKQRIAGRQGHLSNRHAAEMVAEIASPDLSHVFLCHLSSDCNRPELALKEITKLLEKRGFARVKVCLTFAEKNSELWTDQGENNGSEVVNHKSNSN